jgi:hypothetical protein
MFYLADGKKIKLFLKANFAADLFNFYRSDSSFKVTSCFAYKNFCTCTPKLLNVR